MAMDSLFRFGYLSHRHAVCENIHSTTPPPPISISSFHFSLCSNKLNLVLQCSGFSCWSVCMELNLEIWLQAPQFPIEIYAIVNHDKTISWQQHHQAAPTERCIFFGYMCDMFSVSTLQSIIRQNRFMLSTALIEIIFNCLSASSRFECRKKFKGGKQICQFAENCSKSSIENTPKTVRKKMTKTTRHIN